MQVALVTGAGAGIGRAIALRLGEEGAAVVVADVDEVGGTETVRRIEAGAGRGAFVLADVSAEAGAREMVDFAGRTFGGLAFPRG
jgi:NAD(P)-dependent dehydrogenase (short-subunit alcohol dehydrogenase family)